MLAIYTDSISFETQGKTDILNITEQVQDIAGIPILVPLQQT